jgi:hypothetical protein
MSAPMGTPHSDPVDFWGAHPNPGPAGSTPPNGGVCNENRAGASKQKLLLGVGLHGKIYFLGGSLQPGALQGPLHKIRVSAEIIGCGTANKSCFSRWVC